MPSRFEKPELYATEEWLALRETIVARYGNRCRNCGSCETLQVHHWLPLPEFWSDVDDGGYGKGENPLLVHESGLITLCASCHAAMTERRLREAALRNPNLLRIRGPDKQCHNIFELWALNDQKLPFEARRDFWSPKVSQFYRVEKVEIKKWPYGTAWGCYVREGVEEQLSKIPNAGTYSWQMSEEGFEKIFRSDFPPEIGDTEV